MSCICQQCWTERAEACANCTKLTDAPPLTEQWACPCGEHPAWEHERCPVCGRYRPDKLKGEVDRARAWQRSR